MRRDSKIDSLRCVCNYMIVLLHGWAVYQYCNSTTIEYRVWDGICNVLMSSSLPVLFFISGYLLMNNFSTATYGGKIFRRIKRLAIPYVAWNVLFVVLYISLANVFPRLNDRVVSYGLGTWSGAISKIVSFAEAPIDGPLWFMRALFFYSLCAPIIFWVGKICRGVFLVATLFIWMMISCATGHEREFTHAYPAYSMLAFAFGGLWAGKASKNIFGWFIGNRYIVAVIGLVGLAGLFCCREIGNIALHYLVWDIGMLLSGACLLSFVDKIDNVMAEHKIIVYLRNASFFVYAGHFLFCSTPLHLMAGRLSGLALGKVTILIFGIFIGIGMPMCLLAYSLGKRLFGKAFSVFDGTL